MWGFEVRKWGGTKELRNTVSTSPLESSESHLMVEGGKNAARVVTEMSRDDYLCLSCLVTIALLSSSVSVKHRLQCPQQRCSGCRQTSIVPLMNRVYPHMMLRVNHWAISRRRSYRSYGRHRTRSIKAVVQKHQTISGIGSWLGTRVIPVLSTYFIPILKKS